MTPWQKIFAGFYAAARGSGGGALLVCLVLLPFVLAFMLLGSLVQLVVRVVERRAA